MASVVVLEALVADLADALVVVLVVSEAVAADSKNKYEVQRYTSYFFRLKTPDRIYQLGS